MRLSFRAQGGSADPRCCCWPCWCCVLLLKQPTDRRAIGAASVLCPRICHFHEIHEDIVSPLGASSASQADTGNASPPVGAVMSHRKPGSMLLPLWPATAMVRDPQNPAESHCHPRGAAPGSSVATWKKRRRRADAQELMKEEEEV